jgi:hypothetical protein
MRGNLSRPHDKGAKPHCSRPRYMANGAPPSQPAEFRGCIVVQQGNAPGRPGARMGTHIDKRLQVSRRDGAV